MRAVILAGGKGTRLRPFTTLIPKPLVPLGGKYSILEIVLLQLARAGFSRVTVAVNHLSHLIRAYFGDGSRLGIQMDYSLETEPLSTIGPLTLIDDLPEQFLVMNGDILCDLDYRAFFRAHAEGSADISVSAFRRNVKIDFGVLEYEASGRLTNFREKPTYSFDVSMGIYCLSRQVISQLEKGAPYGFDNLMIDSIKGRFSVNVKPFGGYWLDIGRPEDYELADQNFEEISRRLGIA